METETVEELVQQFEEKFGPDTVVAIRVLTYIGDPEAVRDVLSNGRVPAAQHRDCGTMRIYSSIIPSKHQATVLEAVTEALK